MSTKLEKATGLVKIVVDVWAALHDRHARKKSIEERLAALEAKS